jgi:N-acyl-D-aspartate/D-glutamate deacylase
MLTSRAADLMGITDRGRLRAGLAADIVVFDAGVVAAGRPKMSNDLPHGHPRLIADAYGIDTVIVNGTIVRRRGLDSIVLSGTLPGRLLRGGQAR